MKVKVQKKMKPKIPTQWIDHVLPLLANWAIYYVIVWMNPHWFVRGHELGIIAGAVVAELILVPKAKRDSYSDMVMLKILVMHMLLLQLEGIMLHAFVEDFGGSLWVAPLVVSLLALPIHHFVEHKFVKREEKEL